MRPGQLWCLVGVYSGLESESCALCDVCAQQFVVVHISIGCIAGVYARPRLSTAEAEALLHEIRRADPAIIIGDMNHHWSVIDGYRRLNTGPTFNREQQATKPDACFVKESVVLQTGFPHSRMSSGQSSRPASSCAMCDVWSICLCWTGCARML